MFLALSVSSQRLAKREANYGTSARSVAHWADMPRFLKTIPFSTFRLKQPVILGGFRPLILFLLPDIGPTSLRLTPMRLLDYPIFTLTPDAVAQRKKATGRFGLSCWPSGLYVLPL